MARPFTDRQKDIITLYSKETSNQMLRLVPLRYEYYEATDEDTLLTGSSIVLEGRITSPLQTVRYRGKQSVTRFTFSTESNDYKVSIFNRPWLKSPDEKTSVVVKGRYDGSQRITASNVLFTTLSQQPSVVPVYPLKEGVKQRDLRAIIAKTYQNCKDEFSDQIPDYLRKKYRLSSLSSAIRMLHFPQNPQEVLQATRTFKYQEFLRYMTEVTLRKKMGMYKKLTPYSISESKLEAFIKYLPFELTVDQQMVTQEIISDMTSDVRMSRLLQGDVGSGKTAVAAIVAYAATLGSKQVAILAPTELLATQHLKSFKQFFKNVDVVIEGLYASMPNSVQLDVIERCKKKQVDILIGTHSIFQDRIFFSDLGLVIVDEQHRFGVRQRQMLYEKGTSVDVLMMSATPIPRTLASTLFADMDVSTIETMPSGRKKIVTTLIKENSIRSILDTLIDLVQAKNQIYVVCPTIVESDALNVKSVTTIAASLKAAMGHLWRIEALHGQLKATEKEAIMNQFSAGNIDVLVSTTVIEVGVDVKQANIMIIYDAHRFGLLQLHQLRGRIGRNQSQAYCYLLTSSSDPLSLTRLQTLVDSDNGFHISMQDLALRGPGDLLGIKQSGLPQFMMGDIVNDQHILTIAKEDAYKIVYSENIEDVQYVNWVLNQENSETFFE